jgi:cytochrome c oxidase subunit 2
MRFQVIAESADAYAAWVHRQQQPATAAIGAAARGHRLFQSMTCINCHATDPNNQAVNAAPNLTHLGSRRLIGSGVVANNAENLRRWLADPQQVKPGVKMPNFKLSRTQVDDLVAYFQTLQ